MACGGEGLARPKSYIGSKVCLISNIENRYEGIWSVVDKENSTVTLSNVICLGNRSRPNYKPIPYIYESILFWMDDIQDVIVLSEPPDQHHGLPPDPAIVESSVGGSSGSNQHMLRLYNQQAANSLLNQHYECVMVDTPVHRSTTRSGPSREAPAFQGVLYRSGIMVDQAVQTLPMANPSQKRAQPTQQQPRPPARSSQRPWREGPQPQRRNPPSSSRRSRNRSRGQFLVKNSEDTTLQFESDFGTVNAQFNKIEIEKEASDGEKKVQENQIPERYPAEKCYDKSKSFYDNLSSDFKPRTTREEQKRLNIETFGVPGYFPGF